MANRPSVAALVINWNGAADTLELLESLDHVRGDSVDLAVSVIDNASSDDDRLRLRAGLARFQARFRVEYRENAANVGVPAAYNQAIQIIGLGYDYYLRLDNDVTIAPGAIERMIASAEKCVAERVGIVGGNVKFFDSPDEDNGGAVRVDLLRGLTRVSYPDQSCVADGVLGCIMLVSARVVDLYAPEVFSGELFICTDETELSLRAQSDGFSTLYLAEVVGYHKGGRSTGRVSRAANYFSARNWTILRLRFVVGVKGRARIVVSVLYRVCVNALRGRLESSAGLLVGMLISFATRFDNSFKPR